MNGAAKVRRAWRPRYNRKPYYDSLPPAKPAFEVVTIKHRRAPSYRVVPIIDQTGETVGSAIESRNQKGNTVKELWTCNRGIVPVEYVLLIAAIVGIFFGAEALSNAVSNQMTDTAICLSMGDGC